MFLLGAGWPKGRLKLSPVGHTRWKLEALACFSGRDDDPQTSKVKYPSVADSCAGKAKWSPAVSMLDDAGRRGWLVARVAVHCHIRSALQLCLHYPSPLVALFVRSMLIRRVFTGVAGVASKATCISIFPAIYLATGNNERQNERTNERKTKHIDIEIGRDIDMIL